MCRSKFYAYRKFVGFFCGGSGNEQRSRFFFLSNALLILLAFIRRGQDLITIEQEYYAFIQRGHVNLT
jgi:hypothetical protein